MNQKGHITFMKSIRKLRLPDKELFLVTLNMAWPAILESFFVAFAGLVDSYMVSSLGSSAVAAVGLTTQPKFMGLSLFFAMNVSVSALVARRLGQNKREEGNQIALTAFLFVILSAILLSITFVVFANPIIRLCGSSADTHDMAVSYFRIIMGGMIFNCVQMIVNAAQRGSGNTKITMRTNVTSNIVNIIMNYALINGHFGFPALGIQGAALATVLGTVVAFFMSIFSIRKADTFISLTYMFKDKIHPSLQALGNLIHIGYSIFFEQILMRIGFMLTAIMAADQGTYAMAAHQVAMNIMGLSFSFGDGLQSAAVALIGRSLGEKNPDKAKAYGSTCRFMGTVISILLALAYFAGAKWLFSLFFTETEIITYGVHIMYVIIFVVIFQISQVIYMGCLRGAGDTLYTAIASTISVTLIRTLVSYVAGYPLGLGIEGIWLGVLGDQVSRFIMASIRFRQGKWVNIKI